ncbi:MAG: DUF6684 family protein [Halobacteriaceae archaeon]
MASTLFTRDTFFDLLVNIIPIAIGLFFVVLYTVVNPWQGSLLGRAIQYGLILVPLVALTILTYAAAKRIEVEE